MKKVCADMAAARVLNLALYKFVIWLRETHQLDDLTSLLVAIEILESLPNILTDNEINTYICKVRANAAQPGKPDDENQ